MGRPIGALVALFAPRVWGPESNAAVAALVGRSERWSAGHAVFDEIRRRSLRVHAPDGEPPLQAQYRFEESCAKAVFNAGRPLAAFDPSSPYFVVPRAFALARVLGVPDGELIDVLVD